MNTVYREHPTPTGHWVDGTLSPYPPALAADTTVWFYLPEEGGTQYWEGLRATSVSDDRARLAAVPLFAYNLHLGDHVSVIASAEGPLVATGIVSRGSFRTFRAYLGGPGSASLEDLIRRFGEFGCLIEGYSDTLIGFGCTVELAPAVVGLLDAAAGRGELIWESGEQ